MQNSGSIPVSLHGRNQVLNLIPGRMFWTQNKLLLQYHTGILPQKCSTPGFLYKNGKHIVVLVFCGWEIISIEMKDPEGFAKKHQFFDHPRQVNISIRHNNFILHQPLLLLQKKAIILSHKHCLCSKPVTFESCKETKKSPKIIFCLAADEQFVLFTVAEPHGGGGGGGDPGPAVGCVKSVRAWWRQHFVLNKIKHGLCFHKLPISVPDCRTASPDLTHG